MCSSIVFILQSAFFSEHTTIMLMRQEQKRGKRKKNTRVQANLKGAKRKDHFENESKETIWFK